MKIYKIALCSALMAFSLTACNDLDLETKGVMDEGLLFKSENGVLKYFAGLYNELPIEDFTYYMEQGYQHGANKWEAQKNSPSTASMDGTGRCGNMGACGFWRFDKIRLINNFIENFPNYKSNYTEEEYNALLSEGYFLRAFYYFGMAERYGGMPIIDHVQDPKAPVEELKVARSTEYDTYKFIYNDLKFAMENGSKDRSRLGRATCYTAAALMCRAMSFAASSARYGSTVGTSGNAVSLGLQIIPEEYAEEFYQYVYDAAKFLTENGYKLHRSGDAENSFLETFTKENPDDEDIMVKRYGTYAFIWGGYQDANLTHSYDDCVLPLGDGLANNVGCALQPAYESIGLYQMPAIVDEEGKPVRFDSPNDIWDNDEMEGRCKATFWFSGMKDAVSGQTFDLLAGVYRTYGDHTQADGCPEGRNNDFTDANRVEGPQNQATIDYNGQQVKLHGTMGRVTDKGDEGYIYMGACIRKYIDNTAERGKGLNASHQTWKVFRYGECLLYWAEACYELGLLRNDENLKREAIDHINEIRNRAGARPYVYKADAQNVNELDPDKYPYSYNVDENLQFIRDEFKREEAFENRQYFDLRRWRVYHDLFQNKFPHAFSCYYILDEGKYIFLPDQCYFGRSLTFNKSQYYEQIPGDEINKNDLLIRNDGF